MSHLFSLKYIITVLSRKGGIKHFVLFDVTDQKLTSQVHEIVGRINGRFGTLSAVPIHHLVGVPN